MLSSKSFSISNFKTVTNQNSLKKIYTYYLILKWLCKKEKACNWQRIFFENLSRRPGKGKGLIKCA